MIRIKTQNNISRGSPRITPKGILFWHLSFHMLWRHVESGTHFRAAQKFQAGLGHGRSVSRYCPTIDVFGFSARYSYGAFLGTSGFTHLASRCCGAFSDTNLPGGGISLTLERRVLPLKC